ncbi:hypothetical protein GCM10015536_70650 [Streptomyces griseomycini]|nr:hypothetical protein GCM10015536_70650 [Streptomyces griseomycini]
MTTPELRLTGRLPATHEAPVPLMGVFYNDDGDPPQGLQGESSPEKDQRQKKNEK